MEYIVEIREYIIKADSYIKNLFLKLSPLYRQEFGEEQEVTIPLFTALHSTSESILILLLNQAVFDADILLRSVMEGTIKYCYLMTGSEVERHEKYNEYKVTLTEMDRLFDHCKALETIDILKKYSSNSLKPFQAYVLSDTEVDRLKAMYPKDKRSDMKRKWGYQTLLRALAEQHVEYRAQIGTLSTYALQSHLGHYDWTGVSSRQAQINSAPTGKNECYDFIHALRIISNTLSMSVFRAIEYMRCHKYAPSGMLEFSAEILDYIARIDDVQNKMVEKLAD